MTLLQTHFPMLRTRETIIDEINTNDKLSEEFHLWSREAQEAFLDFCTGARGVKLLYDSFFKEVMNPDAVPGRMEDFLSNVLGQKVRICKTLPNESVNILDNHSLLVLDIIVQLADGSIANVEVQKIGYAFPGQRCACYSADLLLRQYKRVKQQNEAWNESFSGIRKKFSYKDIQKVYTIVLFEKSTDEFHHFSDYVHRMRQKSDTGLELNLLQEYIFFPLDIFLKFGHNKTITNKLEAWLTMFASDRPEDIIRVIKAYPDLKRVYEDIYEVCLNVEKVMGMFSKELKELDDNTVDYMIDEMQDKIDSLSTELQEKDAALQEALQEKAAVLQEKDAEIKKLRALLAAQKNK
jgi:hypothetical protein